MDIVGYRLDAARKLFRIRIPVSDLARPPEIECKDFGSRLGRSSGGSHCECLVDVAFVAPCVEHHIRKLLGIRYRIRKNAFGEPLSPVSGLIPIAMKYSNKSIWHREYMARFYAMMKLGNRCIELQNATILNVLGKRKRTPVEF